MTEEDRKLFKDYYGEWSDKIDARKELNKDINEDVKRASDVAGYKPGKVKKVFAMLKKKEAEGDDELEELNEIFAELEV